MLLLLRAIVFAVVISALPAGSLAKEPVANSKAVLDDATEATLQRELASDNAPSLAAETMERKLALAGKSAAPLMARLKAIAGDKAIAGPIVSRAKSMLLQLLLQSGKLKEALAIAETLWANDHSSLKMSLGALQEANKQNAKALDTYESILNGESDDVSKWTAATRLALLKIDGVVSAKASTSPKSDDKGTPIPGEKPDEPAEILKRAVEASPEVLRDRRANQAAMILAMSGKPGKARALYRIPKDAPKRVRHVLRVAQWSLDDRAWDEARALAEEAERTATLKRDRRYALALLTESYRGKNELPKLIETLLARKDLGDEAQDLLIELLRETGQPEKALSFFTDDKRDALTPEIQRQFLEMLRDAGRADEMVTGYKQAISREPTRLQWRSGLSRYYLEEGEPERARNVWRDILEMKQQPWIQLGAAEETSAQGLHKLAFSLGETAAKTPATQFPALLFLADVHVKTGETKKAEAILDRFNEVADAKAKERLQLAEVYERLGRKDKAAKVLEDLRTARGIEHSEEDLDMRLAVLLTEVERDADALKLWMHLWQSVKAPMRRSYVEDRILTVAAREGELADIAVNLEERLLAGTASEKESGLLIRLYTRVGDPVSAAEVLEERVKRETTNKLKALQEQARIYLTCTDYYNYEIVVRKLIESDPEGERDYLRQLAMSALERGRPLEARGTLRRLKELEGGVDGAEFEAGILALGGLNEDAIAAYRKGIAAHPERIEVYLLLANTMKDAGQKEDAIGMFMALLDRAQKDDLFTVAVDGLLNMEAPNPVLQWARRRIVERVSARMDRVFLFQLFGDLSEQLKETPRMITALSESLPVAGERRASILREVMEISTSTGYSPFGVRNGGDTDNAKLRYGRRLLLLGDVVPPQVYLDLGRAFLESDEVSTASRTFSLARDLPDFDTFRQEVAETFEKAGYLPEALRLYQRALIGQAGSIKMLRKIGTLHELEGRYDEAFERAKRAIDLILTQRPFADRDAAADFSDQPWMRYWGGKNLDAYDEHYTAVLSAFLGTMPKYPKLKPYLDTQLSLVTKELDEVRAALKQRAAKRAEKGEPDTESKDKHIARVASFPRLHSRAAFARRLAFAHGVPDRADKMDLSIVDVFAKDKRHIQSLVRGRLGWGIVPSAVALIEASGLDEQDKSELHLLAGRRPKKTSVASLAPSEAVRMVLAPLMRGDEDTLRSLIRRVDVSDVDKDDVSSIQLLAQVAVHLGEEEVLLSLGRAWLRLAATSGNGWMRGNATRAAINFCWPHLDEVARKSLVQPLGRAVIKEPKQAQHILPVIEDVQATTKEALLTETEAKEVIDKLVGGKGRVSLYSVAQFFALLPDEAHAEFLRTIIEKEPIERRAQTVIWAIGQIGGTLSADALDYLEGVLKGSLKKQKQPMRWWSYGRSLTSNKERAALNLRFLRVITGEDPDEPPHLAALALAHRTAGEAEKAWAFAEKAFTTFMEQGATDWTMRAPLNQLITEFGEDHADKFMVVIGKLEKQNGPNETTTEWKLNLLSRGKDAETVLATLQSALKKSPKSKSILDRIERQFRIMSRPLEMIQMMQARVDDAPDDTKLRNKLAAAWKTLRHPLNARRAKKGKDPKKGPSEEDKERAKKKFKPATVKRIKEAMEAGDTEKARILMHQMWRGIRPGARDNRYGSVVIFVNGQPQIQGGGSLDSAVWPGGEVKKRRLPRGGFPDFAAIREAELEAQKSDAKTRTRSAYEVLVEQPFGRAEIERKLRTLSGSSMEGAAALLQALNHARAKEVGEEALLKELLDEVTAGRARSDTYYRLLLLVESQSDELGEQGSKIVEGLMTNVKLNDTQLLLRIATCLAASGRTEDVARVLLWCARVGSGGSGFNPWGGYRPQAGSYGVIQAVRKHLKGDLQSKTIEQVLAMSDPRRPKLIEKNNRNPWGTSGQEESYSTLLLGTWSDVIGPAKTLKRFSNIVDRSLDTTESIQRSAARSVAVLSAQANDYDTALKALEVAACGFLTWEFPEGTKIDGNYSYYYDHRRRAARRPVGISTSLLYELFVKSAAFEDEGESATSQTAEERVAWLVRAFQKIASWRAEERLLSTHVMSSYAVISAELQKAGAVEEAAFVLAQARAQSEEKPARLLWIADALRAGGNEREAHALERELLSKRQIHLERIADVVRATQLTNGPKAALALGESLTDYTLHPELLRAMIEAADAAGDKTALTKWNETAKDAWPKLSFKSEPAEGDSE